MESELVDRLKDCITFKKLEGSPTWTVVAGKGLPAYYIGLSQIRVPVIMMEMLNSELDTESNIRNSTVGPDYIFV
jgi:hypothetical protein